MYVNRAEGAGYIVAALFFIIYFGGMLLGIIDGIKKGREERKGETAVRNFLIRNGFDPDSEGGQRAIKWWRNIFPLLYKENPNDDCYINEAVWLMDDAYHARKEKISHMTLRELERELDLPYRYLDKYPSEGEVDKLYTEKDYQAWKDAWEFKHHKLSEPLRRDLWEIEKRSRNRSARSSAAKRLILYLEYPQYDFTLLEGKSLLSDAEFCFCYYLKYVPLAKKIMTERDKAGMEAARASKGEFPYWEEVFYWGKPDDHVDKFS